MLKSFFAYTPIKSILWPAKPKSFVYQSLLVIVGSLLIGLSSQIQIPLTIVPITLQTLAIFFIAMTYGPRLALMSLGLFYGQILLGLPVTAGPTFGPAVFVGPTGGFIIGWGVAMYIAGYLVQKGWGRSIIGVFVAQVLGSIALYSIGLLHLSSFVGWSKAFSVGLLPFIPGDLLKMALLSFAIPVFWQAKKK